MIKVYLAYMAVLLFVGAAYGQSPVIYYADQQSGADACVKIANA